MIDYDSDLSSVMERLAEGEENIRALSKEDILELHDFVLEKFGGSKGIRDNGLFVSTCIAPYNKMFGIDRYPTVIDKAAKYLYDFANYQIFLDGNKRTGLLACKTLCHINGYDLKMSPEQYYFLTIDIANHKINTVEEVSNIIKEHVKFNDIDLEDEYDERF